MSKEEIDILLEIIDLYGTLCDMLGAENKLNGKDISIGDTLLRLRSGEYQIRSNPDWWII